MATYYIRKTGSDANAGTSAGASWLTWGKALGASGVASGDTVYIGGGQGAYRESVTVNMTSATVETFFIGDVDGSHTGDAGEVQLSLYLAGDVCTPSASGLLLLNGRDFLTFKDIVFIQGGNVCVSSNVNTSTNINFTRCLFQSGGTGLFALINITSAANVALNWVIDSCIFFRGSVSTITYTPVRPATADFDINFIIKNCLFIGGGSNATNSMGAGSGANTFNTGGVLIYNCSYFGGAGSLLSIAANWSTSIPCKVYNCLVFSALALVANALGMLIEDYNLLIAGASPRSNVTAGAHSVSDGSYAPLFYTGHEYMSVGSNLMPFGMPKPGSPILGFGNQAATVTTDILQVTRPSGFVKLATGTATSGAAGTITLSTAAYGTNSFAGTTIKIISGTGSGQTKTIKSNTATAITVDGNWKTNPDSTSVFEVYLRATSSTGTATAGSTTTLTDSGAAWGVNMWAGYTLTIDTGTGSGQTLVVVSNTATVLTFATATAPDNTSTYSLFRGASVNVINPGVGCYENGQSAIQDTITFLTSPNSWCIAGAGYHDFYLEVRAVATTVTVYAQYDAAYSGTLPSMNIVNGTQCGVANATATQVGAASTFEALTLSFTPTANGIITLRLISSSTTPTGNAYFDQFIPFN